MQLKTCKQTEPKKVATEADAAEHLQADARAPFLPRNSATPTPEASLTVVRPPTP